MVIGLGLISAIIIIKYKPIYAVKVEETKLGYIENKRNFEDKIDKEIICQEGKNIDFVTLTSKPTYELKLLNRSQKTNEDEIIAKLKESSEITYKYYAVALDNEIKSYVSTIDEAKTIVEDIKSQYEKDIDLDLQIRETYTTNTSEITTETIEIAENNIEEAVDLIIEENGVTKINGIKVASMPIDPNARIYITSRFKEVSSIRSSWHKGLDIACATGTSIKTIADGKITFSGYDKTGLGYAVKIDHGNGVQTVYAHCSKLYVSAGQEVKAGDTIAAVGSTGNSTGPHLHIEIRINGVPMNPQGYIYNK